MILTNGYYVSNQITRKEYHGGGKIIDRYFVYYIFKEDGKYISYVKNEDSKLKKSEILNRLKDSNEIFSLSHSKLILSRFSNTKFSSEKILYMNSSTCLKDDKNIEYHFHPWPDES